MSIYILVCLCFLQIATVKSPVGQEMFLKTVLRKSWSPGEESSTDGKASEETERLGNLEIECDFMKLHGARQLETKQREVGMGKEGGEYRIQRYRDTG